MRQTEGTETTMYQVFEQIWPCQLDTGNSICGPLLCDTLNGGKMGGERLEGIHTKTV